MVVANASGSAGEVVAVDISILDAKTGISGYAIVVSVADTTVGMITNVRLPEFGLTIVGDLPAGSVDITAADLPAEVHEGLNDWKRTGYGGACPPIGRHRYFHKLYALDTVLEDLNQPTRAQLESAMKGHILAQAQPRNSLEFDHLS